MLYVPPDEQKPKRVQGVFVSDEEIRSIVGFWTADRFANLQPEKFDDLLLAADRDVEEHGVVGGIENDPLIQKAIDLAREHQTLSTSMLQRKLRIGYPRAARTMDELEDRGIVAPGDGTSSRQVLLGEEASPGEGRTLAAEAADFEPVAAGAPTEPEPEERDADGRKLLQFPKAFDDD